MEDQAIKVVGDVGECQFRLRPRDANGADEQAVARLVALHLVSCRPSHIGNNFESRLRRGAAGHEWASR